MRWYCTRDLFGSQIPVTAGGFEPQKIGHILKNKQKFKCVYIHEIRRLIIMKMKMKMKYRSHRYDINRPRSTHEHKFSKCKKCRTMMMLMCINQH